MEFVDVDHLDTVRKYLSLALGGLFFGSTTVAYLSSSCPLSCAVAQVLVSTLCVVQGAVCCSIVALFFWRQIVVSTFSPASFEPELVKTPPFKPLKTKDTTAEEVICPEVELEQTMPDLPAISVEMPDSDSDQEDFSGCSEDAVDRGSDKACNEEAEMSFDVDDVSGGDAVGSLSEQVVCQLSSSDSPQPKKEVTCDEDSTFEGQGDIDRNQLDRDAKFRLPEDQADKPPCGPSEMFSETAVAPVMDFSRTVVELDKVEVVPTAHRVEVKGETLPAVPEGGKAGISDTPSYLDRLEAKRSMKFATGSYAIRKLAKQEKLLQREADRQRAILLHLQSSEGKGRGVSQSAIKQAKRKMEEIHDQLNRLRDRLPNKTSSNGSSNDEEVTIVSARSYEEASSFRYQR